MAHVGEELALGPVGGLGLVAGPLEDQFGVLPIGEVAGDFRESHELAGFVAEHRDDDVGPEVRAVLADSPAVILEASLGRRDAQFVFG